MGWDAYACREKFDDYYKENLLERLHETEAAPLLAQTAGSAALLGESIHVTSRAVARALSRATGAEPFNVEWWPKQVRDMARNANWDFEPEEGEDDNKKAAQMFLQVCAANDLGIRFD